MGILDKLKRKKQRAESPAEAVAPQIVSQDRSASTEREPAATSPAPADRKIEGSISSRAYQILRHPILSEKGTHLASKGKYVFAVAQSANKPEIKKSIQQVYKVHVVSVHIIKMPGKNRRYGRSTGRTTNWKKAVVTVRPGEKIAGIIEAVG